jgi:tetratricopeptide (TPR) repeat protein
MRHNLLPALALIAMLVPVLGGFAQGLREKGAQLLDAGRYEEARALGLAAVERDGSDLEASILLCQSLIALTRSTDAENYALKAWQARRDPRLAEILGEALFTQGRNEEALTWFRFYLSSTPEGPKAGSAYYFTGEIYLRLGHYGHADIALTTALRHSPGNARWWSRLGWAQEKAGDANQALKSYGEALRIDPRLEDAVIGKKRVLARLRG